MKTMNIVYRCCESDTKTQFRPTWFSKEKCLDNFLDVFHLEKYKDLGIKIHVIHDGPKGLLFDMLYNYTDITIYEIDYKSNKKSLIESLDFGYKLIGDYLYFVEDDYLHTYDFIEVITEGLDRFGLVTGYDHPDRMTRTDDLDYGKTHIRLGKKCYWRTAESTTCTWATTQSLFDSTLYMKSRVHLLNDREFFRDCYRNNIRLHTPMSAKSTHCHLPFMSPFVDWEQVCP